MRRSLVGVVAALVVAATIPDPVHATPLATSVPVQVVSVQQQLPPPTTTWTDSALALTYDGPPPTTTTLPPPTTEPPPPPPLIGTVRDRALAQLAAMGAVQWQLNVFDCIGWNESGWQSKRSNQMNSNGTWDHGPFQINDVHNPQLRAQGLDPYVPEHAAIYAWQLSRQGTRFGAWMVAAKCGV